MTTITDGVTTVEPLLVLGWSGTRPLRSVVHQLLGRTDPDVTLRASGVRTGSLEVLCADAASMQEIVDLHAAATVLTISDDVATFVDMTYVVAGEIAFGLHEFRNRWVVTIPYQEVVT